MLPRGIRKQILNFSIEYSKNNSYVNALVISLKVTYNGNEEGDTLFTKITLQTAGILMTA